MTGHTEGGPSSAERDDEPEAEPKGEPERPGATAAADVTQLVEPPAKTVETADPAALTVEVERPAPAVAEPKGAGPAEDGETVEVEQPAAPPAAAETVETAEVGEPADQTADVVHDVAPATPDAEAEPDVAPAAPTVEVPEPAADDPRIVDLAALEAAGPDDAEPIAEPVAEPVAHPVTDPLPEPVVDPVVVDSVVVDSVVVDETGQAAADPWAGEEDPYGPYDTAPGTTVVAYQGEVDGWVKAHRRHRRQTLTFAAGLGFVLVVGLLAYMTFLGRIAWPFGGKVDVNANLCTRSKPLPPKTITLRVYNGSGRNGLAMQVTRQLQAFGFVVEDTGNDPLEAKLTTPIEVRHGDTGVLASKTTAAYLVGKVHDVVDDRQSESVDVVLGKTFSRVKTRKEVTAALVALTSTLPETCPAGATPSGSPSPGSSGAAPTGAPKPTLKPTPKPSAGKK